jgi:hypothetical protein
MSIAANMRADPGLRAPMLDREKIVAVLKRRFPGLGADQIAAAANAIVGLEDEWEELTAEAMAPCPADCYLKRAAEHGQRFKVFRKYSAC